MTENDSGSKYFTKVFFNNTIETSIEEALKIGNDTTTFIRIYWGMELILIYEEINRMLKGIKRYPKARIEKASQRALFYGCKDLEKIKYILKNNLDRLDLNENTDINGQLYLEF
jgi:hypothetical protein